jgi:hypothetical protein
MAGATPDFYLRVSFNAEELMLNTSSRLQREATETLTLMISYDINVTECNVKSFLVGHEILPSNASATVSSTQPGNLAVITGRNRNVSS